MVFARRGNHSYSRDETTWRTRMAKPHGGSQESRTRNMTKEQFITELIRRLQTSDKVRGVHHIPTSNVIVEMENGDKFSITIGKMRAK